MRIRRVRPERCAAGFPSPAADYTEAELDLNRPDNTLIVQTIPVHNESLGVTAYDGTIDFGGTSSAYGRGIVLDSGGRVS